jgi:cyanophycin synthetase
MAAGTRCKQIELVLDELDAVRRSMAFANTGDLVVLCVDKHAAVLGELEDMAQLAQAGAHVSDERLGDPDQPATG